MLYMNIKFSIFNGREKLDICLKRLKSADKYVYTLYNINICIHVYKCIIIYDANLQCIHEFFSLAAIPKDCPWCLYGGMLGTCFPPSPMFTIKSQIGTNIPLHFIETKSQVLLGLICCLFWIKWIKKNTF